MYRISVLKGDGIGPEIVESTVLVVKLLEEIAGQPLFNLEYLPVGLEAYEKFGTTFPQETQQALKESAGAILGPVSTHMYTTEDMPNPSGRIRKEFDLYANLRPVRSVPGIMDKFPNIDLLIVRENTEGFYSDRNMYQGSGEFMPTEDAVLSMRLVTRKSSERIARTAFEMARKRNRKNHVSAVHKANVLKKGCGMFLEECRKVQEKFPEVILEDFHIDAYAMYLVLHPEKYDVIVTTNMFGDILSDQAAGLIGGLGLAPGLNMGDDFAVAQAAHGSAPSIAGRNIANPIALILSTQMLLEWLGLKNQDERLIRLSEHLYRSIWNVLEKGEVRTPDLGGTATTQEICNALLNELSYNSSHKA